MSKCFGWSHQVLFLFSLLLCLRNVSAKLHSHLAFTGKVFIINNAASYNLVQNCCCMKQKSIKERLKSGQCRRCSMLRPGRYFKMHFYYRLEKLKEKEKQQFKHFVFKHNVTHLEFSLFVASHNVALAARWQELRSEHPHRKCGQYLSRMLVIWRE